MRRLRTGRNPQKCRNFHFRESITCYSIFSDSSQTLTIARKDRLSGLRSFTIEAVDDHDIYMFLELPLLNYEHEYSALLLIHFLQSSICSAISCIISGD